MRKAIYFATILLLVAASVGQAQIQQSQRMRDRMDRAMKGAKDREHDAQLERESRLPVPKPAIMNVDVQMVLSKGDHKTFAEAKAAEAKKVVDGEQLWLYIKFRSKLGDYVLTTRDPDDREKLRYTLFVEVSPRADISALNQYSLQFTKDDLNATEVKLNLAPGRFGRNKSIPVFLMTSEDSKTGVWNNEFRLANSTAIPRSLSDNLATTPVVFDFSTGLARYKQMASDYDSIILRGTTDLSRMPVGGTFFDQSLADKVKQKVLDEGITPEKVYFSGDDWEEFASFALATKKFRRVFATFAYQRDGQCFYGVAEVVENYNFMQSKFDAPEIAIQKDLPVACQ